MASLQFLTSSSRWQALTTRDPLAANAFIYAVTTTKIYCRPTCSARLARRANVIFFATAAAALASGFRACKRCKPDAANWDSREGQRVMVEKAKRVIEGRRNEAVADGGDGEDGVERVGLAELAKEVGRTKSHFHRVFKRVVGVTPRVYGELVRKGECVPVFVPGKDLSRSGGTETDVSTLETGVCCDEWNWNELEGRGMQGDLFSFESVQSSMQDIEYTIQPWLSGFVLIAATSDSICCIDAGDSEEELLASLQCRFPIAKIVLSEWLWGASFLTVTLGVENERYCMFETVMEALTGLSGKMMEVAFDVPAMHQLV